MAKKSAYLPILLGLLLLGAINSQAQQYLLNLTATYKTTNEVGQLVNAKMTTPTLLNEIFADVPTARTMVLVYDVETGEVLVVQRATGVVLGAWYQFTLDTSVETANGSKSENYWTITCPVDEGFAGTAVGTVQILRDEQEAITKFKMQGKFSLRYQGESSSTRVYSGVFSTGARYIAPESN